MLHFPGTFYLAQLTSKLRLAAQFSFAWMVVNLLNGIYYIRNFDEVSQGKFCLVLVPIIKTIELPG